MLENQEELQNFLVNTVVLANISDIVYHTLKDIKKNDIGDGTMNPDMLDQKLVRTLVTARINQNLLGAK